MLPLKFVLLVVFTLIVSGVCTLQTVAAKTGEETLSNDMQLTLSINSKTPELSKLKKRMAAHNIPVVSIAFMENYKITWTLTEEISDFVSQQAIDKHTVFHTAIMSKHAYDTFLLQYGQDEGDDVNTDVKALIKSRQLPKRNFSKSRPVNLPAKPNLAFDKTVQSVKPHAVEAISPVFNVFQKTNLANNKTILTQTNNQNNTNLQITNEQLTKRDTISRNSIVLALKGSAETYAPLVKYGMWITPSDLLTLASLLQKNYPDRDMPFTTDKTRTQKLIPQIEPLGIRSFLEKQEGIVTSLSDNGVKDGFSTHLFIHSQTGDGIAIMTNSDNGGELINDLMPSINQAYGWKEYFGKAENVAVIEPEMHESANHELNNNYSEQQNLPQSIEETLTEELPERTVVLVAEGEQF